MNDLLVVCSTLVVCSAYVAVAKHAAIMVEWPAVGDPRVARASILSAVGRAAVPGQVQRQGRYAMEFAAFNAGIEDFVLSQEEDVFHLRAFNQPKGGFTDPMLATVHFSRTFAVHSVQWKQLSDPPVEATYTVADGKIEVVARQQDKELGRQTVELDEDTVFTPPVYAGDYLAIGALQLEVQQTKTYKAASFGYPDWHVQIAEATITRKDDSTMILGDQEIPVRVYESTMKLPFGETQITYWCDEQNFPVKTEMTMPLGKLRAVLMKDSGRHQN